MAFTYSGDPLASPRDEVRFLLGDTSASQAKLQDAEVDFLLAHWENDTYAAAAAAADLISNNAAPYYDFATDGGSTSIGQLQERYRQVARTLRQTRAQRSLAPFYVGGIDRGDVEAHEADVSVVHPDFGTGMHDNRREGAVGGTSRRELRGEYGW